MRHLTILGRIAIVKNLVISKLVFCSSVLNTPADFVKEVNSNIFSFVWNFKPDKIKRKTLIGPACKGGLNMVNFVDVVKSLKITWVKRYCESTGSHWCARLDSLLVKVGGAFLFQCNYDLKMLNLKNLPSFYKNILETWQELSSIAGGTSWTFRVLDLQSGTFGALLQIQNPKHPRSPTSYTT